ncbi:MAG: hypothetical protein ABIP97_09815 [Chthoniobacterales bacterium]
MTTKKNTDQYVDSLTNDARTLLAATADMADGKIKEARERMESALDNGKQIYNDLRDKTSDGLRIADSFVHDNPYKAVGFAVLIGALLLLALRRRD